MIYKFDLEKKNNNNIYEQTINQCKLKISQNIIERQQNVNI